MRVCSAEGCLNRLTSYSPSDLLLLALFALKKNLCLSCSVIPSPNLPGLLVTWRSKVLRCGCHPHGASCMKLGVCIFILKLSAAAQSATSVKPNSHMEWMRYSRAPKKVAATLTFPRAVGSCWSLHMWSRMSACWTLPVLFSPCEHTFCFSQFSVVWTVSTNFSFTPSLITP